MYIGVHYGSLFTYEDFLLTINYTLSIGGNAIQIFNGKNTSTTTSAKQKAQLMEKEMAEIKQMIKKNKMKLFIHGSLSLNLSNPLIGKYKWNVENLIYDLKFGSKIGAKAVVVHLGVIFAERYLVNDKNKSDKKIEGEAYKNYAKSLEYALDQSPKDVKIFIETSAGTKNKIGTKVEDLGRLYGLIGKKYKDRIGFCIDTCHIFSAGYDISDEDEFEDYMKNFDKYIGIKKIGLFHLNDSARELGSKTDVHESLTYGYIFKNNLGALKEIVKFAKKYNIPIILETRNIDRYASEIKLIKKLAK